MLYWAAPVTGDCKTPSTTGTAAPVTASRWESNDMANRLPPCAYTRCPEDAYRGIPPWIRFRCWPVPTDWTATCALVKVRSEEHTSELQSHLNLVCRLLLEKKKKKKKKVKLKYIYKNILKVI